MDRAYLDWPALAASFGVLGWVAYQFTRRTYRITASLTIVAGVIAVTAYGFNLGARPANFLAALTGGGNEIARHMFGPLIPAGVGGVTPGLAGWVALGVLTGALLVVFDTGSTRRQQPSVQVGALPPASPENPNVGVRRRLTEELKFRLPAVAVRSPASMPGGSKLESLASVVSESGVQGSKLTAALMQAVHALEARPRIYEVGFFIERPDGQQAAPALDGDGWPDSDTPAGAAGPGHDGWYEAGGGDRPGFAAPVHPDGPGPDGADGAGPAAGGSLLITVSVQDARSGQSIITRVLRPQSEQDAAERIAGFTARQVFRRDASTPAWASGSVDGEDLSAYLLAQEIRPAGTTFTAVYRARQARRQVLEPAVRRSANAGLVQYELASLYELDRDTVAALLMHLDNRVCHPRFLSARYRLGISLSALGGPASGRWAAAGPSAELRQEIITRLRWAGMIRRVARHDAYRLGLPASQPGQRDRERRRARVARAQDQIVALLSGEASGPARPGGAAGALERAARDRLAERVLLLLARRELRAVRRRLRAGYLLWTAVRHRPDRAAMLSLLRSGPRWWRHPRRRLWAVRIAQEIAWQRLCRQENPGALTDQLEHAQARWLKRLGLAGVLGNGRALPGPRVPWQAVYNLACLYAVSPDGGGSPGRAPRPEAAGQAIALLRLAINDPECELDRPSVWISADPDLWPLRPAPAFQLFVREQARRDFDPSDPASCPDKWFAELLPARPPGRAAGKAQPAGTAWHAGTAGHGGQRTPPEGTGKQAGPGGPAGQATDRQQQSADPAGQVITPSPDDYWAVAVRWFRSLGGPGRHRA